MQSSERGSRNVTCELEGDERHRDASTQGDVLDGGCRPDSRHYRAVLSSNGGHALVRTKWTPNLRDRKMKVAFEPGFSLGKVVT